jgi:regulator of nucleoside diphosphate kinase
MTTRQIYITRNDLTRLEELLRTARTFSEERDSDYLGQLEALLEGSYTVSAREVPADVVTMNSRVRLTSADGGSSTVYTVVFPADADAARQRVSVLAPLGAALLGCRVGQDAVWETPEGTRHLRVAEMLYQPEAAGDYHL